jgi:hypothetical protein
LKWTRFVCDSDPYRRRAEVLQPWWEVKALFIGVANWVYRGTYVLYARTICNLIKFFFIVDAFGVVGWLMEWYYF